MGLAILTPPRANFVTDRRAYSRRSLYLFASSMALDSREIVPYSRGVSALLIYFKFDRGSGARFSDRDGLHAKMTGNINSRAVTANRHGNLSSTRFPSIQWHTGLIRRDANPFRRLKVLSSSYPSESPANKGISYGSRFYSPRITDIESNLVTLNTNSLFFPIFRNNYPSILTRTSVSYTRYFKFKYLIQKKQSRTLIYSQ